MSGPEVDVLVPTRNRPVELATTLAGIAAQRGPKLRVVLSDQSDGTASYDTPAAGTLVHVLRRSDVPVELVRHLPRRELAEHRASLLARAQAPYLLFCDDDVWLAPGTVARLHEALGKLRCGFVGAAVQGQSYVDGRRPDELESFELWEGEPEPEAVTEGSPAWRRWTLHNAANPTHLSEALALRPGEWRAYKVAWVGGCVLYDRAALLACGGFDFWRELPVAHAGADVVAQWRVMARCGRAGILPSGAYHLESPTTVPDRRVEARDVVGSATGATRRTRSGTACRDHE